MTAISLFPQQSGYNRAGAGTVNPNPALNTPTLLEAVMSCFKSIRAHHVLLACLLLILGCYARLAWAPLRMQHDSAEYLEMAAVKADGYTFPKTRLPNGYPYLIVALERLAFANQAGFAAVNVIGLSLGLAAFVAIGRASLGLTSLEALGLCLAAVLYRPTFEIAVAPQPELAFFGASMLAVYCFSFPQRRWSLVTGLAFSAIAVSLRSIGVALILPAAWAAWKSRHRIGPIYVAAAGWTLILSSLVKWTGYFGDHASGFYRGQGFLQTLWFDTYYRFDEIADLATNTHFPLWHSSQMTAWICVLAGTFACLMAVGLWTRLRSPLAGFFVGYLAVLIGWPASMPRFVVPIAATALAFTWIGAKFVAERFDGLGAIPRILFLCWAAWFAALGVRGIHDGLDWRGASATLKQERNMPYLTTAEVHALAPDNLAFQALANIGLTARRYGGPE